MDFVSFILRGYVLAKNAHEWKKVILTYLANSVNLKLKLLRRLRKKESNEERMYVPTLWKMSWNNFWRTSSFLYIIPEKTFGNQNAPSGRISIHCEMDGKRYIINPEKETRTFRLKTRLSSLARPHSSSTVLLLLLYWNSQLNTDLKKKCFLIGLDVT